MFKTNSNSFRQWIPYLPYTLSAAAPIPVCVRTMVRIVAWLFALLSASTAASASASYRTPPTIRHRRLAEISTSTASDGGVTITLTTSAHPQSATSSHAIATSPDGTFVHATATGIPSTTTLVLDLKLHATLSADS